ncbi:MAG: WD40 repeat domain-containing protein, partial [Chloroflexi bacterium]|nr:WD40 repeat domain-containing protein [Chloroflexota bacterium]
MLDTNTNRIAVQNAPALVPVQALGAHDRFVTQLAFSPDGRLIATGTDDRTITLWDAATGARRAQIAGAAQRTLDLHFAQTVDHLTLWAADESGTVTAFAIAEDFSTRITHTLTIRALGLLDLAIDGAGRVMLAYVEGAHSGEGGPVYVIDVNSGDQLARLENLHRKRTNLRFSHDGRLLAAGGKDGLIKIWDTSSWAPMYRLAAQRDGVKSVCFSPDNRTVAALGERGEDKAVLLLDLESGEAIGAPLVVSNCREAVFSPDGSLVATTSAQLHSSFGLWEVQTGRLIHTLLGGSPLAFSPDGAVLASGATSLQAKTIQVLAPGRAQELEIDQRHAQPPITAATAARVAYVGTLRGHTQAITALVFSPDSQLIASGSLDRTVRLREAGTGAEYAVLRGHNAPVTRIAYSPDGALVASSSGDADNSVDNTVRLWNVAAKEEQFSFHEHRDPVSGVDFHPDGSLVASSDTGGRVLIWETYSGKIRHTLEHSAPVNDVAFSPDGVYLASASGGAISSGEWNVDNSIGVWDVETGKRIASLQQHRDWVKRVSFSPDGGRVMGIDYTNRLFGWEVPSWLLIMHGKDVTAITMSPDGSVVVIANVATQTLKLVAAANGQQQADLTGHEERVGCLAFSPDGRLLAS